MIQRIYNLKDKNGIVMQLTFFYQEIKSSPGQKDWQDTPQDSPAAERR